MAAFWNRAEAYDRGPDGKSTSELDAYRQAMKPVREFYGPKPVTEFGPLSLKANRRRAS